MDNDPAGWKATTGHWVEVPGSRRKQWVPGLIELLEPYCEVWVVDSPWAADPADMDDRTVDDLIANAVPGALWEPPAMLLCWHCKQAHTGKCAPRMEAA
jgi:hypothetical protein